MRRPCSPGTRSACRMQPTRASYAPARRRARAAARAAALIEPAHPRAHAGGLPHRRRLLRGARLPGRCARADPALAASPSSSSAALRRGSIRRACGACSISAPARAASRSPARAHLPQATRRCGRHQRRRRSRWRALNVRRHRLARRVRLVQIRSFPRARGARYDIIVSNPPYVGRARTARPAARSTGTSRARARGRRDGLDSVRAILLAQARRHSATARHAGGRSGQHQAAVRARSGHGCRSPGCSSSAAGAGCSC